MFKLDLHTHSEASEDGGLSLADYRRALKTIDYIAVTDHNTLAGAKKIQRSLGPKIIVGCEISTAEGDIIGLFLRADVPPGLTLAQTIDRIHTQAGLVMVPHPFEGRQRASINLNEFANLIPKLDIIETYNGRSLSLAGRFKARRFAKRHTLPQASNSDAHGPAALGRTWSQISSPPTARNLAGQLASASFNNGWMPLKGYLEPAINRRRSKRDKIDSRNKRKS